MKVMKPCIDGEKSKFSIIHSESGIQSQLAISYSDCCKKFVEVNGGVLILPKAI
jgi:hypothetical protein